MKNLRFAKATLSLLFIFLSFPALAFEYGQECRVEAVGENPWEEGLGEYGSQDVDGDSQTVGVHNDGGGRSLRVSVGQMSWRTGDGDSILQKWNGKGTYFRVTPKEGPEQIEVRFFKNSERGEVYYRESSGKRWLMSAKFDCSSVEVVEKVNVDSANAVRLTEAETALLPEKVLKRISVVDMAYELGDGYYDQTDFGVFKVSSPTNAEETVGYLIWGRFDYTEGDPTEALVRFDRNGLRLGPIENLGGCQDALSRG